MTQSFSPCADSTTIPRLVYNPRSMNAKRLTIAVLFAAMLVVSACSSGGDGAQESTLSPSATTAQQPIATAAPVPTAPPPGATAVSVATAQPSTTAAASPARAATATPNAPLAKNFTLPSGDGKNVSLESYRNTKNVVVVFHRGFW